MKTFHRTSLWSLLAAGGAAVLLAFPAYATRDLNTVIDSLRNWVADLLAALATPFLTIGAARYLTANGNPRAVEEGKAAIKSSQAHRPNVLGQSASTVDLANGIDKNKILLVSLAKGLFGEETSRPVGSFMVARVGQAAMERPAVPRSGGRLQPLPGRVPELPARPQEPRRGPGRGPRLPPQPGAGEPASRPAGRPDARGAGLQRAYAGRLSTRFQSGQEDARYLAREFDPWLE